MLLTEPGLQAGFPFFFMLLVASLQQAVFLCASRTAPLDLKYYIHCTFYYDVFNKLLRNKFKLKAHLNCES